MHLTKIEPTEGCCSSDKWGILCKGKDVTEIHWASSNATGLLPEEIGNLKALKVLDLRNNALSGVIPSSYYELKNLESLNLKSNDLSGTLRSFEELEALRSLDISDNGFHGNLARNSFSNLMHLTFINVAQNTGLDGVFPQTGPSVRLINVQGTEIILCGDASKVAVPVYYRDTTKECNPASVAPDSESVTSISNSGSEEEE
jgi:Leucine-rich repeat (LRR) protein